MGRLKNGNEAHDLTPEDRARGAEKRWAEHRRKQEEARRLAIEQMAEELKPSIATLVDIRDNAETTPDRRQAAQFFIDHIIGKPTQRTELTGEDGGPVVLENDVNADTAERLLAGLEAAGLIAGVSANGDSAADEVHPARPD